MKFAKVLEQTLIEEDIPEAWVEAAIQYKSLKKCINKVVNELKFLGLEQNTLKLLIEDSQKQEIHEVNENETIPSNPTIAEYTLTKSRYDNSDHIIPMLRITLNYENENFTDDHIYELGLQLKQKIETLLNNDEDSYKQTNNIIELKEENDELLILSPQSSILSREGSPVLIETPTVDQIAAEESSSKKNEIFIMLNSDTKFFQMLKEELENLDNFKAKEESKLIEEIHKVSDLVQTLSNPNIPIRKSDLYKWRELFRVYLDSEVYFKYNETSSAASERKEDQIKKNLNGFIDNVNKSDILSEFNNKKSLVAFNQFLNMNYHLLKVLQFQTINSTAFRKILKKFDKQTALGVKNKFPKLVSDDHIFITGRSIAQSICYIMQNSIITIIPQLDDYTCPICCSIAFKPIKLECGHVFCVRCLVKLKQQSKTNCPICRHERAVEKADSTNLDLDSMTLMKKYFPLEVKEKLKERQKERYEEVVGNSKCIIM